MKVLVVEDSPTTVAMLVELLKMEGHEVFSSATGAGALAQLREGLVPDIALLDLLLPDTTGTALLAELRKLPELAGMPVMLATASGTINSAPDGFAAFLPKPFNPDQFLAILNELGWRENA